MVLTEDTRQQVHHGDKHKAKHVWWTEHGVEVERRKLDFGDYAVEGSNVCVDTKRNVAEIAQNIGGSGHARFKRECERARDAGYRLVVLVENRDGFTCVQDVCRWTNTHCVHCRNRGRVCKPHAGGKCIRHGTMKPIQGARLAKAMKTMEGRYGVRFMFCAPSDAARIICELLGVMYEE